MNRRIALAGGVGIMVSLSSWLTVRPRYPNMGVLECLASGVVASAIAMASISVVSRVAKESAAHPDKLRSRAGDCMIALVGVSMLANWLHPEGVLGLILRAAFWVALVACLVLLALSFFPALRHGRPDR